VIKEKSMGIQQKYKPQQVLKNGKRIPLVDDDSAIANIGRQILEHLGYYVDPETSPIAALNQFRREPYRYNLVITDMIMPRMTGDELALEIMKIRKDIPIIMWTGYGARISDEKTAEIGIKEIVMKPLRVIELARAVSRALDEERQA
jgi:two-component system cell cycle sensor histidine kinase/response regulator CckA